MLLVSSVSSSVWPHADARTLQRRARREVLLLLATATCLLVLALLLGRTPLGLTGAARHRASWTDGPPGLAALRLLRVALLVGSVAFVTWLAVLAVMCVPRRTAASMRLVRLPLGRLVRAALVGTVALGVAGSSGGDVIAASRPAVVADDATGGQRWPDLPQQPVAATPTSRVTTPLTTPPTTPASAGSASSAGSAGSVAPAVPTRADGKIQRALTILPRLVGPTTSSRPTAASAVHSIASLPDPIGLVREPIASMPAGPSLADAFDPRIAESDSSIATRTPLIAAGDATSTRIVRAGESFWSIAEDEVLGSVDEATDADVIDYWRRLIGHNRSRLPDPTNPDLLWVGTALVLPPFTPGV